MQPMETGRGRLGTILPIVAVLGALAAAVVFGVMVLGARGGGDDDVAADRGDRDDATTTTRDDDRDDDRDSRDDGKDDGNDIDGDDVDGDERPTTTEPLVSPEATTPSPPTTRAAVPDLLGGGFPTAFADLLAAAGQPGQLLEISVYDGYAFLAYRDPAVPGSIDRREWRDGRVGEARPNPAADRVDARTEPDLFAPTDLDPTILAQLVADAPLHYDLPVNVTHVIIDRFLPFDQRVLVRVYAVPADGRSGGGYVSYDTAGALVRVCC